MNRIEGGWEWIWVFGAFYAPWGLRAALRGEKNEAGNQRFWSIIILICLLAFFSSGCSMLADNQAARDAEWNARFSTVTMSFHSVPSGAVVDWNGDVIGTTPFVYEMQKCYYSGWPLNGNPTQTLRARWLDGTALHEFHPQSGRPPRTVLFMHPHAQHYLNQPARTLSLN